MAGIRILNRSSDKAAVLIKQFAFHDKLPLGHIVERIPLDGRDVDLTVFREPVPECQMAGFSFLFGNVSVRLFRSLGFSAAFFDLP